MFRFAYIIFTSIISKLLPFVSNHSTKIKRFTSSRKITNKPEIGQVKYWLHCASLGEYEMAIPLIEKLSDTGTLNEIIITIFSPSGYTQATKGKYRERLMYLPLDTLKNVKQFYTDYAPQKAIFVRYDFWYNFINEGQKKGIDFYLINSRFTQDHFVFKWYGRAYLKLLNGFKGIYTSDTSSTEALTAKGIKALFTGDTRYDRVNDIAQQAKKYDDIATFIGQRKVLMLGSSWQPEEELVAYLMKNKPKNLAIIIAPHDLNRSDAIAQKLASYSPKKYTDGNFSPTDNILILNTMGMLSTMYQYADFALIGGGFSGALHNIIEPAIWGCHISFGPKTDKFPEVQEFRNAHFATAIKDKNDWLEELKILTGNPLLLEAVKTKAKNFTQAHIGATDKIIHNIS